MYKVLVITEEGRGGGALGRIRLIASELRDKIQTVVLAPKGADNYIKSLHEENIETVSTRIFPLSKNPTLLIKYILSFIPEIWSIYRIIKKQKPDVVHCNGSWQIKGIIASFLAGVKSIWQMNDSYQSNPVLSVFRILGGLPNAFIFAGERTQNYYSGVKGSILSKPSRVIQAPVKIDRAITSRSHELETSVLRLLLVGYVNDNKGIDLLIEALSDFEQGTVICDIVGPVIKTQEGYKSKLDELSTVNGVQLNFLGYKKITKEVFSNYDFYICSSRREASPMSVWEALSFGIPVLSTPVGDVKKIIEEHGAGFVAEDISAQSITVIIKKAKEINQKTYDQWSHNSLKAATLFDHERIAGEYFEFYTDVISD